MLYVNNHFLLFLIMSSNTIWEMPIKYACRKVIFVQGMAFEDKIILYDNAIKTI